MKISTNWLKDFVTLTPPLGDLADRLTMAGLEVKRIETRPEFKDTVLEVEVTPNRPDWLSHLGVAREIRAVENTGLKIPPFQNLEHRPMPSGWRINLKEADGSPYYTACLIEGVQIRETPDWMHSRLLACGLRPINLFVDITNYVLLEFGQPLHAFDADLLQGKEIQVRRAKTPETLVAIDGKSYSLSSDDLVIADHERAIALAGVMGGRETEVGERTRNILLESAFFSPRWIRRTSLRHGLASESSYRFERRVDPEVVDWGRERALYLFRELAGARNISAVLQAGRKPFLEKPRIHLSLDQLKKVLGMEVKPHQVHSVLTRIGLDVKNESPETWVVHIPSYRADLERPVDLVEEVARIVGYDQIPESLPARAPLEIPVHPLRQLEEKTRDFLAGIGLFETVTFSLVNPTLFQEAGFDLKEKVQIHNPIHQELTLLRPSFLVSLLELAARNERAKERTVAVFEIANLYSSKSKEETPQEEKTIGILLAGEREAGWNDPKRAMNFYDLKGIIEGYFEFLGIRNFSFSGRSFSFFDRGASINVGKEGIGFLGEVGRSLQEKLDLYSRPFYGEINLAKLIRHLPGERKFTEIPRYPVVERDLSLVLNETVPAHEIVADIEHLGKGLVREVKLFDLFRGGRIPKGKKNLSFRITYQAPDRTLLSEEVQSLHQTIAAEMTKKFRAVFQ